MGNCGSSLDCDRCYSSRPEEGCETILEINADIAGIGVGTLAYIISSFLTVSGTCLFLVYRHCRTLDDPVRIFRRDLAFTTV